VRRTHSSRSLGIWPSGGGSCWFPSSLTGFGLEQSNDLRANNGTPLGLSVNHDPTTRSVTVTPPVGNQYYRLKK